MEYKRIKDSRSVGVTCEICGREFDIIEEERQFCIEGNIPLPRVCLGCRKKLRKTNVTTTSTTNRK